MTKFNFIPSLDRNLLVNMTILSKYILQIHVFTNNLSPRGFLSCIIYGNLLFVCVLLFSIGVETR